ncbi:MAG: hypothetical protein JKX70_02055 [Phycisphaerales bacterium]|nr:hypothetical protein [Phycisphaerales bacterium]
MAKLHDPPQSAALKIGAGLSNRIDFDRVLSDIPSMEAWNELVKSMNGAIDDPSHTIILGCAIGFVLVLWIHWKIGKWVFHKLETPKQGK